MTKASRHTEEYYYSLLLLFLPHVNNDDLIKPYNSYKAAFINKNGDFDKEAMNIGYSGDELENIIRSVHLSEVEINVTPVLDSENGLPVIINDTIPCAEINNCSAENIRESYSDNTDLSSVVNDEFEWHQLATGISNTDYMQSIESLTNDQLKIFLYVKNHLKSSKSQLQIFITGGAGVGKSYLIKTLVEYINTMHAIYSGVNPVVVLAPTGIAACNINGYTIHTALKIPVQHSKSYDFKQLSSQVLQKLRNTFRYVHTIIIDEISMVSALMLEHIHLRLQAIRNNDLAFGGFHMILCGRFLSIETSTWKFCILSSYFMARIHTICIATKCKTS